MYRLTKKILSVFSISLLLFSFSSFAALDIQITRGVVRAIPIAVVPFSVGQGNSSTDMAGIISNDLSKSGQFNVLPRQDITAFPHSYQEVNDDVWKRFGVDNVVVGQLKPQDGAYKVDFSLMDLYKGSAGQSSNELLLNKSFQAEPSDLRRLAHHMSDLIYEKLTGDRGVFSTRIAYVLVQPVQKGKHYTLVVADADAADPRPILISRQPIMSPAWSPDGRKIAYVSFETRLPQIYISDIYTGQRQLVTSFSGINGAPAWSPDGKKLAVALSMKNTNPNIYVMDVSSGRLTAATDNWSINTEPSWSPDGRSIIFTSDRGGSPQIYQVDLDSKQTKRLTFDGTYNSSASFLPDGKRIVMLHRTSSGYNIALMDLQTGNVRQLTFDNFSQSPSLAPNGRMVLYATESHGRKVLGMVSINGQVNLRIPDQRGEVQEPAWSPFLG